MCFKSKDKKVWAVFSYVMKKRCTAAEKNRTRKKSVYRTFMIKKNFNKKKFVAPGQV